MTSHSIIKPLSAARDSSTSSSSSNMHYSAPSRSSKLVAYSTRSRKRVSKPVPPSAILSRKLKQQRLRHPSRAPRIIWTGSFGCELREKSSWRLNDTMCVSKSSVPVCAGVALPRQLPRSPFREPRPQALAAVNPELVHTNIEYMKDCLELRGSEYVVSPILPFDTLRAG